MMNNNVLMNKIPIIKRARFFYLYDLSNKRYLDFYVNNGKNFLGHRVTGLNLLLKQTYSRGLTASYPSVHINQFKNELFKLFKDSGDIFVFKNKEQANEFIKSEYFTTKYKKPWENKDGIYEFKVGFSNFEYPLFVDLPLSGCLSLSLVVTSLNSKNLVFKDNIDPFTIISSRNIISKILSEKNEIDFNVFKTPLFSLNGRYMFPNYEEQYHEEVFNTLLEGGYLINPNFKDPSLVPLVFSKGDLDNFKKLTSSLALKIF